MRSEFVKTLRAIMESDRNVILITGDLGFGVLTPIVSDLSSQFINAGIAEQNMTGVATGLALEGKSVFTYSIANFPTLRCYEQIRNDVCLHRANVKIVAVGGGFSYGPLGVSHHATEDLAAMRALPNMTVFAPGDPEEAAAATRAAYATPGPCYIRLGRGGEPKVHEHSLDLTAKTIVSILEGGDVAIFATGAILKNALEATRILRDTGIEASLFSVPVIKPADTEGIAAFVRGTRLVVTVEEHSVIGGLGSIVAEVVAAMGGLRPRLKMIGLEDYFSDIGGSHEYMRDVHGLSVGGIVSAIRRECEKHWHIPP